MKHIEISKNYQNIQFILKPVQGSGGYDINMLNKNTYIQFNKGEFILAGICLRNQFKFISSCK